MFQFVNPNLTHPNPPPSVALYVGPLGCDPNLTPPNPPSVALYVPIRKQLRVLLLLGLRQQWIG